MILVALAIMVRVSDSWALVLLLLFGLIFPAAPCLFAMGAGDCS